MLCIVDAGRHRCLGCYVASGQLNGACLAGGLGCAAGRQAFLPAPVADGWSAALLGFSASSPRKSICISDIALNSEKPRCLCLGFVQLGIPTLALVAEFESTSFFRYYTASTLRRDIYVSIYSILVLHAKRIFLKLALGMPLFALLSCFLRRQNVLTQGLGVQSSFA